MDYAQSTPLDPRARWSRENFYEGDVRTANIERITLAQGESSDDIWEALPISVRNIIAEVLEIRIFSSTHQIAIHVDGSEMCRYLNPAFPFNPFPVHKPECHITVENLLDGGTSVSAQFRYRRKCSQED